jgi:hypothetical protein
MDLCVVIMVLPSNGTHRSSNARSPFELIRPPQILDRQFEELLLAGEPGPGRLPDRVVVVVAGLG